MSSALLTVRRVILTAIITGAAATGGIFGVQLKETQQAIKVKIIISTFPKKSILFFYEAQKG